ncbi:MAG TPA: hypothetical protein VG895_00185 [Patescibacteria group bacterium]|nr:hypothetical protein [Gammaproteobacteria bacterium]HWA51460.1 hypothetical protein [Patescibacteria group bacterium]
MAFTFFRKKSNDTAPTSKNPQVKPSAYKMTGWDWAKSIASFGIYYFCVVRGKQAQEPPAQHFTPPPISRKFSLEPKEVKVSNSDMDAWDYVSAKLTLLGSEVETALKSQNLTDLSRVNANFNAFLSQCRNLEFLKEITEKYVTCASQGEDSLTHQLNFMEKVHNEMLKMIESNSKAVKLTEQLRILQANYSQLRTKLIFKQHQPALEEQLRKPQKALDSVALKLAELKSNALKKGKVLTGEADDTKPYDNTQLPELSAHNDPKQYLAQRSQEFRDLQNQLRSMFNALGITDIPEYKCSHEISDDPDAEDNLINEIDDTYQTTLAILQTLPSNPAYSAIAGEVGKLTADYRDILPKVKLKQGAKDAKNVRHAEALNLIRLNPALEAFYEEIISSFSCLITGAEGAKSKLLATTPSDEETYADYVIAAVGQLDFIPGITSACSFIDSIKEYVCDVLKEEKFGKMLNWSKHIKNQAWLEKFAILLTLAKREEILAMVNDAQTAAEEPRLQALVKRQTKTLQEKTTANSKLAKKAKKEQSALSSKVQKSRAYKRYISSRSPDKEVFISDLISKSPELTKLKEVADQAKKRATQAEEELSAQTQALKVTTAKLAALQDKKTKPTTGVFTKVKDFFGSLADKAEKFKHKLDETITTKLGTYENVGDKIDTTVGAGLAIKYFTSSVAAITSKDNLSPGKDDSESATMRLLQHLDNQEQQTKPSLAKASQTELENYYLFARQAPSPLSSAKRSNSGPMTENLDFKHFSFSPEKKAKREFKRRDSHSFLGSSLSTSSDEDIRFIPRPPSQSISVESNG